MGEVSDESSYQHLVGVTPSASQHDGRTGAIGPVLPFCSSSKRRCKRPLHFVTCPKRNSHNSAVADGQPAPIERRQCCGNPSHRAQHRRTAGLWFIERVLSTQTCRSSFVEAAIRSNNRRDGCGRSIRRSVFGYLGAGLRANRSVRVGRRWSVTGHNQTVTFSKNLTYKGPLRSESRLIVDTALRPKLTLNLWFCSVGYLSVNYSYA